MADFNPGHTFPDMKKSASSDHLQHAAAVFKDGQVEILDSILSGLALDAVLEQLAHRIEDALPAGAMCSIYVSNADQTELYLASASSLPAEFNRRFHHLPIGEGIGSCGTSAKLGRPVIIDDITTHPYWSAARDLIIQFELKSCWSFPALSPEQKTLGTVGIYLREHRLPTKSELALVDSASQLAGLAIERSLSMAELHKDEKLLKIAGQNARLGGWSVEIPNGRLIWSDEVCAIHDEPPGTSPDLEEGTNYYLPESRPVIERAFQQCTTKGVPYDEELQIKTAKGRILWVRSIGEAIRDADGNVIRVQGAIQDVTDKKLSDRQMFRLSERLNLTLESISDAVCLLDRKWHFTYLNPVAERLLQKDAAEIKGKTPREIFPSLDQGELGDALRKAVETKTTVTLDEFHHRPTKRWFEVRIYPVETGIAVYFRDNTEKRLASEQLRLLQACIARINDIVIISDLDESIPCGQRIVFVNAAFVKATGYEQNEVIGKPLALLHGPRTSDTRLTTMRRSQSMGEESRTELIYYRKDGTEFWVESDTVPLGGADESGQRFVAVLRDISRRKESEAQSAASEIRYISQRNALISLCNIPFERSAGAISAFRRITEVLARALKSRRAGIWLYNEDRSEVHCAAAFDLSEQSHSAGRTHRVADHPLYFSEMESMHVVAIGDVRADPLTHSFTGPQSNPNNVTALLDAPILFHGVVQGILCCDDIGSPRSWTEDEKTFVTAVANVVSLELEATERRKAEAAVGEIQKRFEIVASATNDAVWDWDLETDSIWWNDGFESLFGIPDQNSGHTADSWLARIHPEDRQRVSSGLQTTFSGEEGKWSDEYRFMRADGSYAHVVDRGYIVRDSLGQPTRMLGGMTDVTSTRQAELDLARVNRALKMLSACNEAQTRAEDEIELLNEICRLATDLGGYRMVWVGYARDDAKKSISAMASAGSGTDYFEQVSLSWDENDPAGRGPAGRTIRSGIASLSENIETDPTFHYWQEAAQKRGYASVVCLPLKDGEKTFGLLGLYGSEVIKVGKEEVKLLQDLADSLAFGIVGIRAKIERQRTQEVVVKLAQAVSSQTGSEFFDLLVKNMVSALGAHGGLIGKIHPDTSSIDTVSFVLNGEVVPPVSYNLPGTPCEDVCAGQLCIFKENVQYHFPSDEMLGEFGVHAYAGIPLSDQNGVAGIMAVFFDEPIEDVDLVSSTLQIFAARVASELDRQVSDARIREQASLLDKARDAILVRSLEHQILYWNKGAERLYGWTSEEAVGESVRKILYGDTSTFQVAYDTTLRYGEWMGELDQVDREGKRLAVESRWTLLRDTNNQPSSILSINTDITEHQELKKQFLRAQRLESIGTLAGGIAHDLNNVLAPISMSIELLRSEISSERGRELLDTLGGSARRGAEMVGQVLTFARGMEGQRVEIQPRHVLEDVVRIVVDTFPKNISTDFQIPTELPPIVADPTQLHQVLLNLCVNARDSMPHGGRLSIQVKVVEISHNVAAAKLTSTPGPHIRFRIEDSGTGIGQDELDRIFEPFFTTKDVGKGTGLGLSTSLTIIKNHGGFIRTASHLGTGSKFDVYLPCKKETRTIPPPEPTAEFARGKGETILFVDDEEPIRRVTGRTLELYGYHVLLASGGEQAIEIYTENQNIISLVITDMMMPGMDGSAVINKIIAVQPNAKIIAASGLPSATSEFANRENTSIEFIKKPYHTSTLLSKITNLIRP